MGINRQSEESADLQIGPTTSGMVRIYVSAESVDLPLDFTPDDAEEIARELLAAAETARNMPASASRKRSPRPAGARRPAPTSRKPR